jgi:hypothetical protein
MMRGRKTRLAGLGQPIRRSEYNMGAFYRAETVWFRTPARCLVTVWMSIASPPSRHWNSNEAEAPSRLTLICGDACLP